MESRLTLAVQIAGIALLLAASIISGKHPDFFQFLRWAICLSFLWLAYISFRDKRNVLGILLAVPVVIYNPVLPLHMLRSSWQLANVTTAILYGVSIWRQNKMQVKSE